MLREKKILIGVTGSIAAYKIPYLVRLLVKEGAETRILLTESAKDFVTPLTLSVLSGKPVLSDFFRKEDGTWNSHIELAGWADAYLIAPATAVTLGKMAGGLADNLVVAAYLAAKCPVFFAPAMDVDMFAHPSTTANISKLLSFGNILIDPAVGELASGLCGAGRLQEPEKIVETLSTFFKKKKDFKGKKVLITAGPTYEAIDPVRFIGNYSSGKMGIALAEEFASLEAEVQLICGPVGSETFPANIKLTKVTSAEEMHQQCLKYFPDAEVTIMAAAVADYKPLIAKKQKIKKKKNELVLKLTPTQDILKDLGKIKKSCQFLAGFALETDNEIINARKKLKSKNLNMIVLNSLKDAGAGFGHPTNKITILDNLGGIDHFSLKSKTEVARDIADKIHSLINQTT
jgi:phosphopantothenoylcysteine decarboxylase/phosphopantothenate--cysteine ligase